MIPDSHKQIDIYVAMTENEVPLIEAYQSLLNTGHYDRLQNLRDVLGQRRVSVPDRDEYTTDPNIRQLSEDRNIYYLDMTASNGSYRIQGGGQFSND
jgi:site-specific DNA-adenine methylase